MSASFLKQGSAILNLIEAYQNMGLIKEEEPNAVRKVLLALVRLVVTVAMLKIFSIYFLLYNCCGYLLSISGYAITYIFECPLLNHTNSEYFQAATVHIANAFLDFIAGLYPWVTASFAMFSPHSILVIGPDLIKFFF